MIAVDTRYLVTKQLVSHLLVSHITLLIQVCFLAQFDTDPNWFLHLLTILDIAYRIFQLLKISFYFFQSSVKVHEQDDIGESANLNFYGCSELANKMNDRREEFHSGSSIIPFNSTAPPPEVRYDTSIEQCKH